MRGDLPYRQCVLTVGQSYSRQFLTVKVTCTKGTAQASPQVNTWNIGNVSLYSLTVRVPNGHVGLTGIVLLYNGIAIFPWGQPPGYLVTNYETVKQDFSREEISSPLTIQTYNTDMFDHSFFIRADIDQELVSTADVGTAPVVPVA